MERIPLARKKWPLVVACAVFFGLELLLYLAVTRHAVAAFIDNRTLEGAWSWASIVGWHLLIALMGLALCLQPLAELRTVFTSEEIVRPRLFASSVRIRWEEAESIYVVPLINKRPYLLRINAPGRSIEINALYYKHPERLMEIIEDRMRDFTPTHKSARLAAR